MLSELAYLVISQSTAKNRLDQESDAFTAASENNLNTFKFEDAAQGAVSVPLSGTDEALRAA